ncbi:MAG: PilZ domain-containing protein [Ectothiorhodospiraceae bacterium]
MTEDGEERRHFSRIPFDGDAHLYKADASFPVRVADISLKGVLLRLPEHLALTRAEPVTLVLALTDDVRITMNLAFAHEHNGYAGFHCTDIDVDSMAHLRRLVELNLGDPGTLQRELQDLARRPEEDGDSPNGA